MMILTRLTVAFLLLTLPLPTPEASAENISGIDVVIVGKDIGITEQPEKVGNTPVVKNCNQSKYPFPKWRQLL